MFKHSTIASQDSSDELEVQEPEAQEVSARARRAHIDRVASSAASRSVSLFGFRRPRTYSSRDTDAAIARFLDS